MSIINMGESMAIFPEDIYKPVKPKRTSCHIYNYLNQGYKNSNGYDSATGATKTTAGSVEGDNRELREGIVENTVVSGQYPQYSNNTNNKGVAPVKGVISPVTQGNANNHHSLKALYHHQQHILVQEDGEEQQDQQQYSNPAEHYGNNNIYHHLPHQQQAPHAYQSQLTANTFVGSSGHQGLLQYNRPGSPVVPRSFIPSSAANQSIHHEHQSQELGKQNPSDTEKIQELEQGQQVLFLPYLATLDQLASLQNKSQSLQCGLPYHNHPSSGIPNSPRTVRSRPDSPIVHRTLLPHDTPLDPEVFIQDPLCEGMVIAEVQEQQASQVREKNQLERPKSPVPDLIDNNCSGQPVQQISVITALPDLLKENNADCMRRVVPKVREVLHVAQQDMQLAACNSFLQILQQQLLPVNNYTQTFLQTIITSLDSRDQDIARAWLDTLLDVIDLLPKDVIKKDILTVAITKGQLSQSVQSRLSCCQILGKIATKFEPFVIKKDILPIVQSLCQDVDYEVRACMCRQLDPVARGLGLEQTKSAILPELVELTNDEESHVRLAGLETVVKILSLLDNDTCINTIIPLVCKFCQQAMNKEDVTLPFVAKQLGKLCHQLQSNLTDEQKKWFVDFFKKLCRLGVKEADRPYNRDPEDIPQGPKFPTGFFQQTSEIDDDDSTVGTRKHAAFNFPSMVLFVGSKSFKSELYSSFGSLCTDPSYIVRKSVAMGIHEVVKSLGNSCFLLINELNQLFKDDSIEVLQGLTVHIAETLETIAKCVNSTTTNAETKQNAFQDLIPSMLQCEAVVASSNNWRLQAAFLDALKCLPSCYHSDLIYQKFAPLLFKKLLYARALPVKHAAGRTLLVLMRHNRRLEQRQEVCTRLVEELCHGRSCYQRCLFIDLCTMIMEDFSRAFFKEYFFEFLLELCSDRVPNVRLKICSMFPRLKKQIKLPADRQLLQLLETCVRKLLMSENDKDVKDVLDKSVKEFDRVQIHVSSKHQSQEEEQLDRKKEEEEKRLIELEEKEKEEESAKAEKKSAEKKKEPSGSKSNSSSKVTSSGNRRGSKAPPATSLTPKEKAINSGGVRTERSGSFAGPSSANNSDKKSPSSRSTAASTKSSGRTSSTNSPKLLTPSSATSSTNSRKGSASSVSSSSSISSTGSRRSSTGSTPNQDMLRKKVGPNRKLSVPGSHMDSIGEIGTRKK